MHSTVKSCAADGGGAGVVGCILMSMKRYVIILIKFFPLTSNSLITVVGFTGSEKITYILFEPAF